MAERNWRIGRRPLDEEIPRLNGEHGTPSEKGSNLLVPFWCLYIEGKLPMKKSCTARNTSESDLVSRSIRN